MTGSHAPLLYPRLIRVDGELYLKAAVEGTDRESKPLTKAQAVEMAAIILKWLGES